MQWHEKLDEQDNTYWTAPSLLGDDHDVELMLGGSKLFEAARQWESLDDARDAIEAEHENLLAQLSEDAS